VKKQNNKANPEPEILEPEPTPKKMGRPSSYTFEVSEQICEQMAGGKGLRQICSQEGMPDRHTVLKWLNERPEFVTRYAQAREALMDWYSEEILRIAFDDSGDLIIDGDRVMSGHHVVQRARLKVDTVKWIMAKLHPGKYGDKPAIEANSGPITISWIESDKAPIAPEPQPPKQLTYQKPELPADLSERDWSVLVSLLETVKRTIPTNSDDPPAEVFEVCRKALLAHFEDPPAKRIVLKPRGKSGKG
jgi:hypothetical protein